MDKVHILPDIQNLEPMVACRVEFVPLASEGQEEARQVVEELRKVQLAGLRQLVVLDMVVESRDLGALVQDMDVRSRYQATLLLDMEVGSRCQGTLVLDMKTESGL